MAVTYSQNGVIVRGMESSSIVNVYETAALCVVDDNGYIGMSLPNYYVIYTGNYAIKISGVDFSSLGLGQVTFAPISEIIAGRSYRTLAVKNKLWMCENLDYKASGIEIGTSGTSSSVPKANYYNNDESTYGVTGNKYGLMYNPAAVSYLENNKATLLGDGWRVPTIGDYRELVSWAGGDTVGLPRLKSATGWSSGNGTDVYGFSVFPTGDYDGTFHSIGTMCNLLTISNASYGGKQVLYFQQSGTITESSAQIGQYSIRLVRDAT
jgi:uncharacterized protein (TIGR02145 family)